MSDPAVPPPLPVHECMSCHRRFPQNQVLLLEGRWICGECKGRVIQTFSESGRLGATVARQGKQLVMSHDAQLPERCIKCNTSDGVTKLTRKLSWHNPAIYFVLLLNILIYAIVATIVSKKATIQVGLCDRHRKRRQIGIALMWSAVVFFIMSLVFAASSAGPWMILAGIVVLLAGLITGGIMASVVTPARIDPDYIRLKGVCPAYLAELPLWRE